LGNWKGFAFPSKFQEQGLSVKSTTGEVTIDWHPPEARVIVDPGGTARVEIPGYEQTSQPGMPRLPYTSVLVAVPTNANPSLVIRQVEETLLPLPAPLSLAGQPQGVSRAPNGQVLGGAFVSPIEATEYLPPPVVLEPLGILRGFRLARVTFYPIRPAGDQLRLTTRVQVVIQFDGPPQPFSATSRTADPVLSTLQKLVINPEHLTPYPGRVLHPFTETRIFDHPGQVVAIEVTRPGLTQVSSEALSAIGFSTAEVDPHFLHLSRAGIEIPYEWEGDEDEYFEAGERLQFYAQPRFSRWTESDVYFLQPTQAPGVRMGNRSADPTGLPVGIPSVESIAEINAIYTPECYCAPIPAGRDGDRWVWDRLQLPSPFTGSYPIRLEGVDQTQPASLSLWLIGITDVAASPDHQVEVSINGLLLGNIQWDGKQAVEASYSIPAFVLEDGDNTLSLTLPGIEGVSVEGVWLDAYSIRYARKDTPVGETISFTSEESAHAYTLGLNSTDGMRAYAVSNPDQPLRLTDVQISAPNNISLGDPAGSGANHYWVTSESGILTPSRMRLVTPLQGEYAVTGADYLVISPLEFIPALADLVALREEQGLIVAIQDVQAIYDTHGDGRPEPSAITAYLSSAYHNWERRPTYVLLVGDGTSDPKRYVDASTQTFIPPYLEDVDPWAGETAADNRYVTLDGNDALPDMLIGRLPANSLAEARTMVAKIVEYEQQPEPGAWKGIATYVADNPDGAGNFPALSDATIQMFPTPPLIPQRLYFDPANITPADFRQAILDRWIAGTTLLMYTGHASIHQWAAERVFHLEDVPGLKNENRLPVVLEMTCFTGSFQVPGFPTLDEELLRQPGGGAVAVWGATGLGIATGHHWLAEGFLFNTFRGEEAVLGTATLAGKVNLATANAFLDLIDTFTLLGDPAMRLVRSYFLYSPLILN
jgi:hypothetical protein